MKKIDYTLAFQKSASGKELYIKITDFNTSSEIPPNNTIKIRIKINNTSVYDVDVPFLNIAYTLKHSTTINYVSIIGISVFRPNTSTSYIVRPRINVNFTSNLNGAISITDQATLFSYINTEIPNFVDSGPTVKILYVDRSWKSTDDAEDSGLNFELCWGYVASKADDNIYIIENPESGTIIYVEDENKEFGEYMGKYIVFYGETLDIAVPLFLSYDIRDWGDTYNTSIVAPPPIIG
jgi:hypothetical protein